MNRAKRIDGYIDRYLTGELTVGEFDALLDLEGLDAEQNGAVFELAEERSQENKRLEKDYRKYDERKV